MATPTIDASPATPSSAHAADHTNRRWAIGWIIAAISLWAFYKFALDSLPTQAQDLIKQWLPLTAVNEGIVWVICAIGFREEFIGQTTGNDGWYGKGIYFSTFPSYCHWYQLTRTAADRAGNICVIANWVLIGKPHFVPRKDIGCALKPGHTTHYAMVHRTIAIGDHPAGTKPDGDEVVIFEPAAILPQYVIELSTGASGT